MRFSKNLENVFPGLSLLRLGGHDFILLLERDAIPDPYFSIPSTPGKARFTSIRNSTSLSPALFVGALCPFYYFSCCEPDPHSSRVPTPTHCAASLRPSQTRSG